MFFKNLKSFSLTLALLALISTGIAMEAEESPSDFGNMAYESAEVSGLESAVELTRITCKKIEDLIEIRKHPRPTNPSDGGLKLWVDSCLSFAIVSAREKDVRDSIFNNLEVLEQLNFSFDPCQYGPLGEGCQRVSLFCIEEGNKIFQDRDKTRGKTNDAIQFYSTSFGYLIQAARVTDNYDIVFNNFTFYQTAITNFILLTQGLKDQLVTLCNWHMRSKLKGYPSRDFEWGLAGKVLFCDPGLDSSERNILGTYLWYTKVLELDSYVNCLLILDLRIQNSYNILETAWLRFQMNSCNNNEGNPDLSDASFLSLVSNYNDYSRLVWEAKCGCELKISTLLREFSSKSQNPEEAAKYLQESTDANTKAVNLYLSDVYQGQYEHNPELKPNYIYMQLNALINPSILINQHQDLMMDSLTASTES